MSARGCSGTAVTTLSPPSTWPTACATAGGLETALDGLVDDELLDGACTIMRALVRGGPAEDISDYEPGPRIAATVVELVGERPSNLVRLSAVVDIRRWAEDFEEHVAIAERCGRVLMRADVRDFVTARLERRRRGARGVGDRRGGRRRPVGGGLAAPAEAPADAALYHVLSRTPDEHRWARLAAFAEQKLPLDMLSSGPRDQLFPAPQHREPAHALLFLLQNMRPGRWSALLVSTGLLNPVIPTRNAALHALGRMPPPQWGETVRQALRRLAQEEPLDEVRERVMEQLARAPETAICQAEAGAPPRVPRGGPCSAGRGGGRCMGPR